LLGESRSLLDFLDAAVLVADLQGSAVYANPAFEHCFEVHANGITGKRLSEIFGGGARESVLGALARACAQSGRVRFIIRHNQKGYEATASPIVSDGMRVGVLLLFDEEVDDKEQLLALQRKLENSIGSLQAIVDALRGPELPSPSALAEDAGRIADALKFLSDALLHITGMRDVGVEGRDPEDIVREAVATVAHDAELARIQLEVEVLGDLSPMQGDTDLLCAALVELLLDRFAKLPRKAWLTLTVKEIGNGSRSTLQIVVKEDHSESSAADGMGEVPPAVKDAVYALRGDIRITPAPLGGRETVLSFPKAPI